MEPNLRIAVLIVSSEESPLSLSPRLQERYKVRHVHGGEQALKAIKGNHFDVLLIAAQLMDMTGADLVAMLAGKHESPQAILVHDHVMALNEALATLDLPATVEQLNRPLGEFTLMQAIDDAAARVI